MLQDCEALSVANEKISPGNEEARQFRDQLLLRGAIEIDHDVSAEDHVKRVAKGRFTFEQVEMLEVDAIPEIDLRAVVTILRSETAFEVVLQRLLAQSLNRLRSVNTGPRLLEDSMRDVGRFDLPGPAGQ